MEQRITDLNDIEMAKAIKEWIVTDEYNNKLDCKLRDYSPEEQDYILEAWQSKLNLLKEVIFASMIDMHVSINEAREHLIDLKNENSEVHDEQSEWEKADNAQRYRDHKIGG